MTATLIALLALCIALLAAYWALVAVQPGGTFACGWFSAHDPTDTATPGTDNLYLLKIGI